MTMAKRNTFVVLASPVCHMALTANHLVGKTFLVAQMCKTDTWTVQCVVDLLSFVLGLVQFDDC